jgi:hypothetical protein
MAETDTSETDAELEAMAEIVKALEPLDTARRIQTLAAVLCMRDVELAELVIREWNKRGS